MVAVQPERWARGRAGLWCAFWLGIGGRWAWHIAVGGAEPQAVSDLPGWQKLAPGALAGLAGWWLLAAVAWWRRAHRLPWWGPPGAALGVALLLSLGVPRMVGGGLLVLGPLPWAVPAVAWGLPRLEQRLARMSDAVGASALFVALSIIHAVFAFHRHGAFGSGSWDLGCMVHNFFRAAHGLSTVSTVLGGVDFLGDHFMPGIYLYAPLIWLRSDAYMVLAIQAVHMASVGPVIYLLMRRWGQAKAPAMALGLVAGLSFGVQSAAYFDAHGITVGFGFFVWGVYFLERGRPGVAALFLATFSTFKESAPGYLVGLGLFALFFSAGPQRRRFPRFGWGLAAFGAATFVVVNRVLMPWFRARGALPEPHETFADFGPTVFSAAVGMLADPARAMAAALVPAGKLDSLAVTLGNVGALTLFAPEVLVAGLPLLAERFLSSKATMWEMGYHYAAPLCFLAAWGAVRGWQRAERWGRRFFPGQADALLVYILTASALVALSVGYRHPANYLRWNEPYFAPDSARQAYEQVVRRLEAEGTEARIAAQNHLVPHLADRPHIYRLEDHALADWVVLAPGASAWPYDMGYPARLSAMLRSAPGWALAHEDAYVRLWRRRDPAGRAADRR